MKRLTVARALAALFAKRIIKLATLLVGGVLLFVVLLTCLLVYFFSPWWWLLLVPFVIILSIFLIIRLIMVLIVSRIHGNNLTAEQRVALDEFIDKILAIVEARSTPLPIFVLICIKDLILHRDITTIKKLISDSVGLRTDYARLEKLF